jgi:predicted RNA-binding Zn-ribbon protein involved in translation (DUF1610 family)
MTGICSHCGYEIENDAETVDKCPRCGGAGMPTAVIRIRGNREHVDGYTPYPERIADLGTPKRREQEIDMMKKPEHWPSHVLAMKRYNVIDGQIGFAVWDGLTLHIDAVVVAGQIIRQASEQIVATPEEIVAMGWSID